MSVVSVDQVHQLCYYLAAKQLSGFPSPNEFNQYIQLANVDLFNYYNDEREKMLLKVKSGESLFVPQPLSDFVVENFLMTTTSVSFTPPYLSASIPANYAYDISFTTAVNSIQTTITKVDYQKWNTCLNSTIDGPTNSYPVYKELAGLMTIAPGTLPNPLYLEYYRYPNTPVWAYTVLNGQPIYNPTGSVDFEFEETELYRLTSRVLKYMGISIRDTELEQIADQMVNTAS